jgi:hypothetical protein
MGMLISGKIVKNQRDINTVITIVDNYLSALFTELKIDLFASPSHALRSSRNHLVYTLFECSLLVCALLECSLPWRSPDFLSGVPLRCSSPVFLSRVPLP